MKRILNILLIIAVLGCSKEELELHQTVLAQAGAFHFGVELPANELGSIGDVYINTNAMSYQVKTSTGWGDAHELNKSERSRFHIGEGFPAESLGYKGDFFLNTQTGFLHGPKPYQSSWRNVHDQYKGVWLLPMTNNEK